MLSFITHTLGRPGLLLPACGLSREEAKTVRRWSPMVVMAVFLWYPKDADRQIRKTRRGRM